MHREVKLEGILREGGELVLGEEIEESLKLSEEYQRGDAVYVSVWKGRSSGDTAVAAPLTGVIQENGSGLTVGLLEHYAPPPDGVSVERMLLQRVGPGSVTVRVKYEMANERQ